MGTVVQARSDIAELMARDPHNLTRDDITAIVQEMRSRRHMFNSGGAQAVKPKTEKQKQIASLAASLDLGDLKL